MVIVATTVISPISPAMNEITKTTSAMIIIIIIYIIIVFVIVIIINYTLF